MIALDYGYDHVIDTLLDSEAKFDGLCQFQDTTFQNYSILSC